jgi:isopenicillin-N N-acyltransferase-like protein
MINTYHSAAATPADRGRDFGEDNRAEIAWTLDFYQRLFSAGGLTAQQVVGYGDATLAAVSTWSPPLAEEMIGLAAGSGCATGQIAALNARTELLARCPTTRGECSTIVRLGHESEATAAVQTWDWHDELTDSWLVWTIEHPSGGVVHTLTEYGILGKVGLNGAPLGVFLNILHHESDGTRVGIPVHLVARRLLDEAADINQAVAIVASARVSASSAITILTAESGDVAALTAEVYPDGPEFVLPEQQLLCHTNHFLAARAALGDREQTVGPDSFFRLDLLRRRASHLDPADPDLLDALSSHLGGGGALCCHAESAATFGARYATLATVAIDIQQRRMTVRAGGPCERDDAPQIVVSTSTGGAADAQTYRQPRHSV